MFLIGYFSTGITYQIFNIDKIEKLEEFPKRSCFCSGSNNLYMLQDQEISYDNCTLNRKTQEHILNNFKDIKLSDTLIIATFIPNNLSINNNCPISEIIGSFLIRNGIKNFTFSNYPLTLKWPDSNNEFNITDPWYPALRDKEANWINLNSKGFRFEPIALFYKNGLSVISIFTFRQQITEYVSKNKSKVNENDFLRIVDQGIYDMKCCNW